MRNTRIRRRILGNMVVAAAIGILVSGGSCLLAQSRPAGTSTEAKLSVDFRVFMLTGSRALLHPEYASYDENRPDARMTKAASPVIHYAPSDGERTAPIRVKESQLSRRAYNYRGTNPLRFFREKSTADRENKIRRVPLGAVTLPPEARRVLLFFFPDGERFRIFPVKLQDIASGEAQVINLTSERIAARMGELDKRLLAPGDHSTVNLSRLDSYSLAVMLADQANNGEWQLRHYQRLVVDDKSSYLVLILPSTGRDGYKVVTLGGSDLETGADSDEN